MYTRNPSSYTSTLSNIRLVPWAGRLNSQEPIIRLPEEKRKVTMTALGLLSSSHFLLPKVSG